MKCNSMGNDIVDISELIKNAEALKTEITNDKIERSPGGLKYLFTEYKVFIIVDIIKIENK